jgi:HEAT repeat protein
MTRASDTPRERIERHVSLVGLAPFAASCAAVLGGEDAAPDLIRVLAGRSAPWFLARRDDDAVRSWQRVWAARGLLWAWHDSAVRALIASLDDEAWRVREMALKVVARHRLGEALPAAAALVSDPVPRVRAAASRALVVVTTERG